MISQHPALTSSGKALNMDEEHFGILKDSSVFADQPEQLRQNFINDGYLYIPGFFNREDVLAVRDEVTTHLAADGTLDPDTNPMDAIIAEGKDSAFNPDLISDKPGSNVHQVLYAPSTLAFYEAFFGEEVLHFDFTWLRVMGPGRSTPPHCDIVYMGRGTFNLMTAWVPYGDHNWDLGGLMILENSHKQQERLHNYLSRDVDTYCENSPNGKKVASGEKEWSWSGALSKDPVSLQKHLGGRWLSTEFQAGDLLTFGMATVHASTDNKTNRIRISSDSRYQRASEPADERWIGPDPIGHSLAGKRGRIC